MWKVLRAYVVYKPSLLVNIDWLLQLQAKTMAASIFFTLDGAEKEVAKTVYFLQNCLRHDSNLEIE